MTLLVRDSSGPAVNQLQFDLQKVAWQGLPITGNYDLLTELTVLMFQRWNGLPDDGVVGPDTQHKIERPSLSGQPEGTWSPIKHMLEVPYYSQRDNKYNPNGTCNVTCLAMALSYLDIRKRSVHGNVQLEDDLYQFLHTKEADAAFKEVAPALYGKVKPQHAHAMLAWAAQEYGATRTVSGARPLEEIARLVQQHPVLLSGRFTGSGHIVLAVGLSEGSDFIVHDPWGDWNQGYQERNGEARVYRWRSLEQVLKPVGDSNKHVTIVR